jgi:aspartyl protease family protein
MTRLLFIVAMLAVLAVSVPEIAPAVLARFSAGPAEPSPPPAADPPEAAAPAEPQLSPRRVALAADPRGHFLAVAEVNGRTINVMVDTGATIVALNEATAARLGISPPRSAFTAPVSTVNGTVKVAPVTLAEIRLNGIVLHDVPAIVVPGTLLETNLLGMSFLGKLSRFEVAAGRLILVQ